MPLRISLSGSITLDHVDELVAGLAPLTASRLSTGLELDLSGIEAVAPASVALLVATLRDARRRRICDPLAEYTPPRDSQSVPALAMPAMQGLLSVNRTDRPYGLFGCEWFSDRYEMHRAAQALRGALDELLEPPRMFGHTCELVLHGLAENVLQHSGVPEGVMAAAADPAKRTFELAVADCGVGIRESLRRNPESRAEDDDAAALTAAVRAAVTGDPARAGSGMGLFLTRLLTTENDGLLVVRSGSARVEQGRAMDRATGLPHLQGTLATVRGRTDRPFDLQVVNQQLTGPAGVDG